MVTDLLLLAAGVCALIAWGSAALWDRLNRISKRREERLAKGLCEHCGYDLTGNVKSVCPECRQAK